MIASSLLPPSSFLLHAPLSAPTKIPGSLPPPIKPPFEVAKSKHLRLYPHGAPVAQLLFFPRSSESRLTDVIRKMHNPAFSSFLSIGTTTKNKRAFSPLNPTPMIAHSSHSSNPRRRYLNVCNVLHWVFASCMLHYVLQKSIVCGVCKYLYKLKYIKCMQGSPLHSTSRSSSPPSHQFQKSETRKQCLIFHADL